MNKQNHNEEETLKEKAKEVAIQHFKEHKNLDITVTKVEFGPSDFEVIFVSGHVTNNPNRKVTADINYKDNYRVESISYDD
ncbi:hypothetical protein ACH0R4_RS21590 [Bacillus cytotoxicus]|uniref:hypothetical protein n=1 Tax=Bacillus cereus group sp. BfR-BA-01492 TaxID=2920361 RepID=UPI001F5AB66C|nr:hypothetical protein [Bacillus cereus group sp. BfR-BA-01492]